MTSSPVSFHACLRGETEYMSVDTCVHMGRYTYMSTEKTLVLHSVLREKEPGLLRETVDLGLQQGKHKRSRKTS